MKETRNYIYEFGRKRKIYLFIIILIISTSAEAQTSKIDSVKIAAICKVWGLIKHYNNDVQSKKIDWDNVLITKYPEIKKCNNFESFNNIILELIDTVAEKNYSIQTNMEYRQIVYNNQLHLLENFSFLKDFVNNKCLISFSWINDSIFSEQVKDELIALIVNYNPKKNKYLKGDIVVKHIENKFLEIDSITEPYRILSLFRYWNNINYYFPYKKITDSNWDSVLLEFIPPIISAQKYSEYTFQLKKLNSRINDSHGFYGYSSSKYYSSVKNSAKTNAQENASRGYLPVNLKWINGYAIICKVLIDSTLLYVGDTIISINHIEIKRQYKRFKKLNAYSTNQSLNLKFEYSISCIYNSEFILEVLKQNDTICIKENQTVSWNKKVNSNYTKPPFYYSVNDSVGYMDITQIKNSEFNKAWHDFKDNKTIIFDLRGYPDHSIVWLKLAYLLGNKPKEVAKYYYPNKEYAGMFQKSKKRVDYRIWFIKPLTLFKRKFTGEIIVLIDANAISQSETVCMMLKAYSENVTFIGRPTSGANGDVVKIDLPGGIYFNYSSLDWQFPDGTRLQRIGILPDIFVEENIYSIINNKDKILNTAIEYAKRKIR